MKISASLAVLFAGRRSAPASALLMFSVVLISILTAQVKAEEVLYTNGSPDLTTPIAVGPIGYYSATDSFTLSDAAALSSVHLALWTPVSAGPPTSLDYCIGDNSFNQNIVGPTWPALNSTYIGLDPTSSYNLNRVDFSVSTPVLSSGTYWLSLGGYLGPDTIYWDIAAGGTSSEEDNVPGPNYDSQYFQINGIPVPEPATILMLGAAAVGLALTQLYRRELGQ